MGAGGWSVSARAAPEDHAVDDDCVRETRSVKVAEAGSAVDSTATLEPVRTSALDCAGAWRLRRGQRGAGCETNAVPTRANRLGCRLGLPEHGAELPGRRLRVQVHDAGATAAPRPHGHRGRHVVAGWGDQRPQAPCKCAARDTKGLPCF